MTLHVTLPDGSPLELDDGATVRDAAAAIGPRLAKAAVAGRVTAATDPDVTLLVDAAAPLSDGDRLDIVTLKGEDADAVDIQRHSASHVMAEAIVRLFPGVKISIGPPIENGFYYDFDFPRRHRHRGRLPARSRRRCASTSPRRRGLRPQTRHSRRRGRSSASAP